MKLFLSRPRNGVYPHWSFRTKRARLRRRHVLRMDEEPTATNSEVWRAVLYTIVLIGASVVAGLVCGQP